MSTTTTIAHGAATPSDPAASARKPASKPRRRHTPGGAALGRDVDRDAQRLAAAILEVLAGVRTPQQAAEALGVSQPRYFQLETRAMHAFVRGCAPRPRGPTRNSDKELAVLRRQHERLQRELARQQTLVRLAQRTIGLAPCRAEPTSASGAGRGASPAAAKSKKRQRRPVVRALRAAEQLQQHTKEGTPEAVTPPETPENTK